MANAASRSPHAFHRMDMLALNGLKRRILSVRRGSTNVRSSAEDKIIRCISKTAEVSVLSIMANGIIQEAQRRHRTAPVASAALGRALMGTLLLGALSSEAETVQVTFSGNGPLGQMTTITSSLGLVKGFVANPLCELPLASDGKLNVGMAIGQGTLTVVRNHSSWKQPYTGTVLIQSGEVAEDLTHYLAGSEQVNCAMGLGINFDQDGMVKFARGFLLQVLPFCSEDTLAKLEENILKMPPLSSASNDMDAMGILECLLGGIGIGELSDPILPQYGPCETKDLRARMIRAVSSLDSLEVRKILKEQGYIEVCCEFCAEVLRLTENDL